jgi:hypothetical protein
VPYLFCSATSTTQTQLSKHARNIVDKISPDKDVARLTAHTPRSLASAIPDPILYDHGQVGPCNDLIFGFSLGDYATAKGLREGEIPRIVRICIAEIDNRGLESEGIYRVSYIEGFISLYFVPDLKVGFWTTCHRTSGTRALHTLKVPHSHSPLNDNSYSTKSKKTRSPSNSPRKMIYMLFHLC